MKNVHRIKFPQIAIHGDIMNGRNSKKNNLDWLTNRETKKNAGNQFAELASWVSEMLMT